MNPILLIDGSSLAYLHAAKPNYKQTLYNHLYGLLQRFETDEFVIVLEDSSTNFRNKIAITNEYKGQRRTEKHKDNINKYLPYLKEVFEEIKKNYHPVTYLGVENDDVIATLHTRLDNSIMLHNDVDYLCIPGTAYNLRKNKITHVSYPGTIEILPNKKLYATGYYQVYSQILKGSSKENYKGLEGCGTIGAYNHLKDLSTEEEMKNKCVDLFTEKYGKEEGLKRLKEGFQLCWIITNNESIETPKIIKFSKLKFK